MTVKITSGASSLADEIARLMGLGPVLAFSVALLMLVLAIFSVKGFMAELKQDSKSKDVPEFKVKSTAVSTKAYENYAFVLQRLSPVVRVSAEKEKLQIEIQQAEAFPEFMYVLGNVQGLSDRVVWKADEICLAGCTGAASRAVIRGYEEKVNVTLGRNQ